MHPGILSWYNGGIRVFDSTEPGSPSEIASYNAEGSSFWTAVHHRSFTIGSDIGGGAIALLHTDRGRQAPPAGDATSVGIQSDGRSHTVGHHPGPDR